MPKLKVLHLPKLKTTIEINSMVANLCNTCLNLEEIGFRVDDTTTAIPIDKLF